MDGDSLSPSPDSVSDRSPSASPRASGTSMSGPESLSGILKGRALVLMGILGLVAALFLPWWSAEIQNPGHDLERFTQDFGRTLDRDPDAAFRIADTLVPNLDWYLVNLSPQLLVRPFYDHYRGFLGRFAEYDRTRWSANRQGRERIPPPMEPATEVTIQLKGFKAGPGRPGLYLALFALLLTLFPLVRGFPGEWLWIGDVVLFSAGAALLLAVVLFLFDCPVKDLTIAQVVTLRQGLGAGIVVELLAVVCLMAGLASSGLRGIRHLGRGRPDSIGWWTVAGEPGD